MPEHRQPAASASGGQEQPAVPRLWTRPFVVLTLCYFLLFLCLQMLLSPLPTYTKERFAPDDFTVSLVTSVFALSAIAARILAAQLMKRVHRNVLLFGGLTLGVAATAAYSFAGSLGMLLLLRVLFGIAFGFGSTIMPTLVSQMIPRGRLGEGVGYFGLSTSLAMSLGPIIGLSVLDVYGFARLTALGAAAVALIIPLLLLFRSVPPQPVKPRPAAAESERRRKMPLNARLLVPALLNMLISITYGGLLSFLALFGKEAQLAHVGLFFLFNVFTVLIVRPVSGKLFDSRGHAAVLVPASLFVIASLLVLSFASHLPLLIVSALLYGLGFGAIQPTLQAWMLRDSAPERHGSVNSLFYNALDFGIAIGSMALGVIASHSSYALMYRYSAGFMIAFLAVYAVFLLARRGKKAAAAAPAAKTE